MARAMITRLATFSGYFGIDPERLKAKVHLESHAWLNLALNQAKRVSLA
jgi:hypothetical protein